MTDSFEEQLRLELHQAAADTQIPAQSSGFRARSTSRSRYSRHQVAVAVAAGAVLAVGVPVTAAAGALNEVGDAFGWSNGTSLPAASDQSTQLMQLTVAGKNVRLLKAPTTGNGNCYSAVDAADTTGKPPLIATCLAAAPPTLAELASATTAAGSEALIYAPGATSITVSSPAGTRSVPVAQSIAYVHLVKAEIGVPVTITSAAGGGNPQRIAIQESDTVPGLGGSAPTGTPAAP